MKAFSFFGWVGWCLFALVLLVALGSTHSFSQSLPVTPGAWKLTYSKGTAIQAAPGGFKFAFPVNNALPKCAEPGTATCPSVNYLLTSRTKAISATAALSITFTITATAGTQFGYMTETDNTCPTPANFRFMFERQGDNLSATDQYYRWWSDDVSYTLGPTLGTVTLTAALSGAWSSVLGVANNASAAAKAGWTAALAHPEKVGITFGGGCFFGHGAYILPGGSATMIVTGFSIN